MAINITEKNFQAIKTLLEDKYIVKNIFSSKKLLDEFIGCNCVYISGKPALIYLNDQEALLGIIKSNGYNVNCIEDLDYFINENKEPKSRDEIADNYSHTKRVESKSFNGLMVSVFDKLEVNFNEKKQYFYPLEGSGLFLHYSSKLQLDDDVIVVGVENPQVVFNIEKYKYLFEKNKKYLFLSISEYKTTYQYKWLESFSGEYFHFGDFDLAGINIYLNTIVPKLKKAKSYSFLIPDNIYEIIKEKNYQKDYSNQTRFLNITSKEDRNLQKLIEFIKDNKITIEQEKLSE
ncbi:MAG: hypothetical protein AB7S49_07965 [Arcobacter sp.]|uniref:DUF7281 domain-containing protein n=1 Tax=Arcobacter sp. TaxID=1872629 RepID=UPI003D0581C9